MENGWNLVNTTEIDISKINTNLPWVFTLGISRDEFDKLKWKRENKEIMKALDGRQTPETKDINETEMLERRKLQETVNKNLEHKYVSKGGMTYEEELSINLTIIQEKIDTYVSIVKSEEGNNMLSILTRDEIIDLNCKYGRIDAEFKRLNGFLERERKEKEKKRVEKVEEAETNRVARKIEEMVEPGYECKYDCKECKDRDDLYHKTVCPVCVQLEKKETRHEVNKKWKEIRMKEMNAEKALEKRKQENKLDENIIYDDKYFFVTLTAQREDGSDEHIIKELEESFHRMHPVNTYNTVGWMHNIELTENLVPHLHGLIRLNGAMTKGPNGKEKHPTLPSTTTGIFNHTVKTEVKKQRERWVKEERKADIQTLTSKYANNLSKRAETSRAKIEEKYRYITKENGGMPKEFYITALEKGCITKEGKIVDDPHDYFF